jgi:hypothetical protein
MQENSQEAERCNLKRLPAPSGAAMDSTQFEKMKVNREMSV